MKVELGKYYVDGRGLLHGPAVRSEGPVGTAYPFRLGEFHYTAEGRFRSDKPCNYDLVSEMKREDQASDQGIWPHPATSDRAKAGKDTGSTIGRGNIFEIDGETYFVAWDTSEPAKETASEAAGEEAAEGTASEPEPRRSPDMADALAMCFYGMDPYGLGRSATEIKMRQMEQQRRIRADQSAQVESIQKFLRDVHERSQKSRADRELIESVLDRAAGKLLEKLGL